MLAVFLEVRVIGLHYRHAELARELGARVVGDERRVDVHEVKAARRQRLAQPQHAPVAHQPVFRIARHGSGRQPQRRRIRIALGARVLGRHEQGFMAELMQLGAKGVNGRGHAVHAREADVGNHQDAQAWSRLSDWRADGNRP